MSKTTSGKKKLLIRSLVNYHDKLLFTVTILFKVGEQHLSMFSAFYFLPLSELNLNLYQMNRTKLVF